jgi:N-methylhydantoinase B
MSGPGTLSSIKLQILWNRLIAAVEEQAQTLIRCGFSTSTREAGDLSAGVFDVRGRMLAQAVTGTPGHVNSMASAVEHFLRKFPADTMRPGDSFVTNDPWVGAGHLNDFTVVSPVFRGNRPVALVASTCHVVDIGGLGTSADGRQVFEEGLQVPIMRLASQQGMNEDLLEIVRANVREPVQVAGDLYSLVACNEVAGRRLNGVMDEFGLANLDSLAGFILDRSKAGILAEIAKLPPGRFHYEMEVDGMEQPVLLAATMAITDAGIDVDFAGTSGLSARGINVPMQYSAAYASYGVKCVVAPTIPNNAGSLSALRFMAPDDTIVNAKWPSAVCGRHAIGQLLPDLMFGCLRQVAADRVPAEGCSALWSLFLSGGMGRVDVDPSGLANATPFSVLSFHSGGVGARPNKDGLSATAFPSGVRSVPTEITEAISPVIVWRKELRADSGGPGRFRGGLGQVMEVGNIEGAPFTIDAMMDRIDHPAAGASGGMPGAGGRMRLRSGGVLRGKGKQLVPAGDVLVVEMPGGGGFGDPALRDREAVADDVRNGFVSEAAAQKIYGCRAPRAKDGPEPGVAETDIRQSAD